MPEPLAIRRRREPLISSGRRRSSGVIERMIASTRSSSFSSTCSFDSWWPARPGIIPSSEVSGPILRICLSWSRKSSSVNWFLRSLRSSAAASSSSTACSAFSMNDRTSPMPRIRWAMRSGWNFSKSPSFSPVEANMIGLPVTALTDSAAPPRASPSSLERITPSNCATSSNCSATLTASWPVIASTTSRTTCGLDALLDVRRAPPSAPRRCAGGRAVSTISTSLPSRLAWSSAQPAMSTGSLVGALLVDGRAGLGADLDELLDGGRAVDVAGGDGDRGAVLLAQAARQLRRGGRLAGALQAGHQDHRRRRAARSVSRPTAPPISAVSSSLTILTTCWPGLSWR